MIAHVVSFMALATIAFANMSQIFDIREIERELESADENTLVIFDVDEVLITTADQFAHPYALDASYGICMGAMKKSADKKTIDEIISLCFLLPERILIEETTPELIAKIQARGIKTIALTSCQTGELGLIPKVEHWRIDDLRSLGIDFSGSFPEQERVVFSDLKSTKHNAPLYERGVLFSFGYNKGDVLKAFLKAAAFQPSKVIFIDDLAHNIENVGKHLAEAEIPYHAFHYTGASRHFREFDPALIRYQIEHLMQHRTWLSDSEAKEKLGS